MNYASQALSEVVLPTSYATENNEISDKILPLKGSARNLVTIVSCHNSIYP